MFALPAIQKDTIRLLRIPFSFFLMPVFLLALSQAEGFIPAAAFSVFLILHLLVYPASNGYNSYVDRDTTSVGGLEVPPLPGPSLFRVTLMLDLLAVMISLLLVSSYFSVCVLFYILASRAYSSRSIRLKRYPLCSFFTVTFFQGAFTYQMAYSGITGTVLPPSAGTLFVLLAVSFHIAGAYPLTQVYQHEADRNDNVTTISMKLGVAGTFIFSAIMFTLSNLFYWLYFSERQDTGSFLLLLFFNMPVVFWFIVWFRRSMRDPGAVNYRNTMRMNLTGSLCGNACFLLLFMLNR
jgi:4-hydroxybenzoate polyprenyltransferase